jgi:SAM-dependent methyltransferase
MDRLAHEQLERLEAHHWWLRGRREVLASVLDRSLAGTKPAHALDLGTGAGGFLACLAARCGDVLPADHDAESLAFVRGRALPDNVLPPRALRAGALPFDEGAFDLVSLLDVIEHVDDDVGALAGARRVLAPGGRALLSVPAHPWLYAENDRVSGHLRRYTRAGLAAAVRSAGLELERLTFFNAWLFPPIAAAVLALKAFEALRSRPAADGGHTNLSWLPPAPVNEALHRVFASEARWLARRDLALGHSLAAIARRR